MFTVLWILSVTMLILWWTIVTYKLKIDQCLINEKIVTGMKCDYFCCFLSYDSNSETKHSFILEPSANFTHIYVKLSNEKNQKQIVAMTSFTDPNNENCDNSQRKLCCLLETLVPKWKHNYTFKEYLAVDEYLSVWKGGLNFPIYIPTKRERCSLKIVMFFESETGYLLNFIVYTGETIKCPNPPANLPLWYENHQ